MHNAAPQDRGAAASLKQHIVTLGKLIKKKIESSRDTVKLRSLQ